MAALAEAFVRVRADTRGVRDDVRRDFGGAGGAAGDEFGRRFSRDAAGRLRDERGRFVTEGRGLGGGAGEGFNDGFGNALRGGLGDIVGKVFDLLTPRVGALSSGFNGATSAVGGLSAGLGKLVLSAGALSTLAAGAASASSGILALGAALAPAAGAVAALPGAVLLAQGAMVTLRVALIGVGEAFGEALSGDDPKKLAEALERLSPAARAVALELAAVRPQLEGIQQAVQDALFAPLQGQLTELVATLAGPLRDGMVGVAAEFGTAAARIAEFARSAESVSAVRQVFSDLRASIADVAPAFAPLLAGFRDLGVVGSGFLSGLAPGIGAAAARFGEFLSQAAASGRALGWMQDALAVFKQLGGIAADVGGIIAGVFRAMESTGEGALGVIGELLDGLHKFVDSAKGQEVLATIFQALSDIGRALLPVVEALAGALATLAPHIAAIAQVVGPILAEAVNALAPALAELGPAIVSVFTQLGLAVSTLAESGALTLIATAIGDILIAVAPLLPALIQLAAPILGALATLITDYVAPALSTLIGWITQAVNWLMGGGLSEDSWLMRIINTIFEVGVPIFQQVSELIGQVFNDLVTWFTENRATVEEWGERIISIIKSAGEIIGGVFEFIAVAWDTFGGPLLDLISGVFSGILQVIDGALAAIKGLIEVVLGVITGDWERAWEGVKTFLSGIWEAIKGILSTAWEVLKFQMSAPLAAVGQTWESMWNRIKEVVTMVWNAITGWISDKVNDVRNYIGRLSEIPGQVSNWFGQVKDAIVGKFNEAVTFVQSIPGRIVSALGNVGGLLYNSGRSILQGLIDGLWSMFNSVWNTAVDILNRIRSLFPFSPAKEGPFSGKGWVSYSGQAIGQAFADGMRGERAAVGDAARSLVGAAAVFAEPSPAPAFSRPFGAFGGVSDGGAAADGAGGGITIQGDLVVPVQGVLDPSDPASFRRLVVQMREAIRELEREEYA